MSERIHSTTVLAVLRSRELAAAVDERTEDIGARRLHTVLERLLDEVSFEAPDQRGRRLRVDAEYVRERLESLVEEEDLSRYIL